MNSFSMVGNKGSDVLSTTGDPRLDLSVNCVRNAAADDLKTALRAVLALGTQEAMEDAFVLAFHTRNIRGGKGERKVFYDLFMSLAEDKPELTKAVLDLVPHYGCWQDLFAMAPLEGVDSARPNYIGWAMLDLYKKQLLDDSTNVSGTLSLAAKWAPREGGKQSNIAKQLAFELFPCVPSHSAKMRRYRQFVSDLNAKLKTVETYMSGGRWDEIAPASVPGRAGKLYARAFLNKPSTYKGKRSVGEFRCPDDPKRVACRKHFEEHFAKAAKGEAKVHGADTLFPHEIVKKVASNHDLSDAEKDQLNGIWRSMVTKAKASGGLGRSIFMSDFSGSMQSSTAGDTPYWVSMALGILGAETCGAEFQDRLMTFDSNPQWHTFSPGSDLFERIQTIHDSHVGQGTSTDFQKAMDLVLQTLKDKRCRPGMEPENLIVLTDMNWDQACDSASASGYTGNRYRNVVKTDTWQTHIAMIQTAFKRAGEDMWGPGMGFTAPRIVIWNLAASAQTDYHATANTPGVAMLSGWSASQFEILQKEGPRQLTAYEMLRLELDDTKYQPVRDRIRATLAA
jgi:hypothetical protein